MKDVPHDKDSWTTPEWLTKLLPVVDLDPCSNPRATVRAKATYSLESKNDGLSDPWPEGPGVRIFVNPPYSRGQVLRWAKRCTEFVQANPTAVVLALVKLDPTTEWWREFHRVPCVAYPFRQRVRFGGAQAGADFCSVLLVLTQDEKYVLPTKLQMKLSGRLEPFPWVSEEP